MQIRIISQLWQRRVSHNRWWVELEIVLAEESFEAAVHVLDNVEVHGHLFQQVLVNQHEQPEWA
jgi:hypothetical protein